jgi:hypothetical protein
MRIERFGERLPISRGAFSLALLAAMGLAGASAQEAAKKDDPAKAAEGAGPPASGQQSFKELKQAASDYAIAEDASPPIPLTLAPEPALRWSNPQRNTPDGAVFLWLAEGRPKAVASLYRYRVDGAMVEDHEFQSLSTSGITARRDGRPIWSTALPGVEFKPIPGAPKPAASPNDRLRQMRALAREFRGYLGVQERQTELRLLTQPLLRYEAQPAGGKDGALFAFVQATDPEILLLIEERPDGGAPAWHYALARMSMVNLRAHHKDREVWSAEWAPGGGSPSMPYCTIQGAQRR